MKYHNGKIFVLILFDLYTFEKTNSKKLRKYIDLRQLNYILFYFTYKIQDTKYSSDGD